ncbi:MAG TPA: zinc-binding dehydrogenase, partial [Arthrobacter sp.]|nr:zinc-binding dehydrogenase [Arthrobacter sp.]
AVTEHGARFIWVRPDGSELARLSELADAGKLTVDIDRTFPMGQAADAMRHSQQGHVSGKIVLTPFAEQTG